MLDSPQWSAHAGRASSVLRRMGQAFRGCVGAWVRVCGAMLCAVVVSARSIVSWK
jgi:hypothetical protein